MKKRTLASTDPGNAHAQHAPLVAAAQRPPRRSTTAVHASLPVLALVAWIAAAGCENTAGDCQLTAECSGAPGVTTTTTTTATCVPSEATRPIDAACGFFVDASAEPGGDGSPEAPFATLVDAVTAAAGSSTRRVYACAGTFEEALVLPAELSLFGGLDCANAWAFTEAGRTTIAPLAGVPLRFEPGALTRVENLVLLAPTGAPPDPTSSNPLSGGSSIAAVAAPASTVQLVRCDLEAADGAPGTDASSLDPPDPAPAGLPGSPACEDGNGGLAPSHTCAPAPALLSGGDGGNGGDVNNPAGSPGASGKGAIAAVPGAPQTPADPCTPGQPGSPGDPGKPGTGGQQTATLLDASFKGPPGTPGEAGRPGNGGAGGGGGKACSLGRGAGGGAGGGGGCAGAGGEPGGAGGSSIALWAPGADVTLEKVTLTTGNGAPGGAGAKGQSGAPGGTAGPPGTPGDGSEACSGGPGGDGGPGGPGGGGAGGHSLPLVWQAVAPKLVETTFTPGLPGAPGPGGQSSGPLPDGQQGLSCEGYDLESGECESP